MIGVYDDDIADAHELIAEFGEPCVWIKPAAPDVTADPWREKRTGVPVEFTPSLAFFSPLDLSRGGGQFQMFAVGTDVVDYSEIGLMAGDCGFVPELRDTLQRTSGLAQIVAIDKIAPNGTPVLYYVAIK